MNKNPIIGAVLVGVLVVVSAAFFSCGTTPPNTPVTQTVVVDVDNDGIIDTIDKCPSDPEDLDGDMDEDGCPEDRKLVTVNQYEIILNEKVYFDTNKTRVLERSEPLLKEVAQVLLDNPSIRIRIEGHTDSEGGEAFNLKLSQGRTDSVLQFIAAQGIGSGRLEAVGFGEERPIDTNATEEGRSRNRRVEIHIIGR
ncbi:MAG: hypothetical protein AUK47_16630 [Deltaproteobacteria bacterium CG2_30_63_29]|nr:MAG: hypothetical protein AUK47_16630 [Deltaproteobacteria bacterium CG2_30_63_29]PIW02605.1 MAG: hypothetical protein COW42_00710 [Deltaproteobacteria bacterium CG17_big_fil_post_rev_8_21_14_2_50_63_7]PJB41969.1 MAG: hypothetical protein CO108_12395 [Deltaproteobacteria bacterium CG_4_9_14_3_um_filter_63_12]